MFKLYLLWSVAFSIIQICPAPCNFDDCDDTGEDKLSTGMYDNFCIEALLYKSYVKIYKNRRGVRLNPNNEGPQLYAIPQNQQYENIYVCINGPAYLYYAKHLPLGMVFHEPEYHTYVHECQFFNGKKGSGNHNDEVKLMGILLMGDPKDYRIPSMQLFTAPLYNSEKQHYENVTSIITFGNQACKLQRGSQKDSISVIIQPRPDKDKPNSLCRLAYQNIENMYPKADDPANTAPANEKVQPLSGTLLALLKNDAELKNLGCEKNHVIPVLENPFPLSQMYAAKKTKTITIKTDYDSNLAKILLGVPKDIILTDAEYQKIDQDKKANEDAIKTEQAKLDDPATTDDDKKLATKAILDANTTLQKNNLRYEALTACKFSWDDEIKKKYTGPWETVDKLYGLDPAATATKGDLDTKLEALNKTYDDWKKAEELYATDKTNDANKKAAEDAKVAYDKELGEMQEELIKVDQTVVYAVAQSDRMIAVYKNCLHGIARINKPSLKEPVNEADIATFVTIEEFSGADPNKITNCETLPKLEEECLAVKPKKNRACRFLKAVVKTPEVCLQDEPANVTEVPPDETTENNVGKVNTEILDLIKDIFEEACPLLDKTFAGRITRVFKCYLMMPTEYEGAGMKASKETSTEPKRNNHMEKQILEALTACKANKRKMIFRKDPDSGPGRKQKRYQYMNDGEWADVHLHSEQADKEFAFNFAIDMHFKMFATAIGLCMKSEGYITRNALMSTMFYSTYSRIFYEPLRFAWTNPADNRIFNLILGNFKNQHGELFANHCMEASFIHGGDTDFRPPRYINVNSNTEANYFTSGNLANKQHQYMGAFK